MTCKPRQLLMLAAAVAAIGSGCDRKAAAPSGAGTGAPAAAARTLEGQLTIIARPGAVERGQRDPAYDWVSAFERSSGCHVELRPAGGSDEVVSLVNQGGYDLVLASGDVSLRLVAAGKVQAIDIARIASFPTLDPRLQTAAWHTVDGSHYGVPFQWGPNLLVYDRTVFKQAPASWSVVFEEQDLADGKSNQGRVDAFDSPIYIADAALYLMARQPELGITDPYQLTEAQYGAALALLRRQKPLVHRYGHDPAVQAGDFDREGVAVSASWPPPGRALAASEHDLARVMPLEGATGWADTTMLAAQAKHPNCAYAWMEWSLGRKVQGDAAAWSGALPAVPAACQDNALLGPQGCQDRGGQQFDRSHFWRTPQARCASAGGCVPYSRWTQDYLAIVAG
jgi:putative spermidine/putrescine transport system substrate-binding protein